MLITIVILGVVMLVVSTTLVAMIKASAILSARTLSRSETEFIMELLDRNISNSEVEDIRVYQNDHRNLAGLSIVENNAIASETAYTTPNADNVPGNEIQFKPIGSDKWTCIAFIAEEDEDASDGEIGYIISAQSDQPGYGCLAPGAQYILLNSDEVDLKSFAITAYENASGNKTFMAELEMEPKVWVPGPDSEFSPVYFRQAIFRTEKLTL